MFSTLELVLYFFLPAYVAMLVMAYMVRRRNRGAVPSLLPAEPSAPAGRENFGEWVAINFGPLGCLLFLPLVLLLAVLSYPYGVTAFLVDKKREAHFLDRMKQAGALLIGRRQNIDCAGHSPEPSFARCYRRRDRRESGGPRTQSQKSAQFVLR